MLADRLKPRGVAVYPRSEIPSRRLAMLWCLRRCVVVVGAGGGGAADDDDDDVVVVCDSVRVCAIAEPLYWHAARLLASPSARSQTGRRANRIN